MRAVTKEHISAAHWAAVMVVVSDLLTADTKAASWVDWKVVDSADR